MSTPTYLKEIKELVKEYGIEKIAALLGVTVRGVQYWIDDNNPKAPRRDTVRKIRELFDKQRSGLNLNEVEKGEENGLKDDLIELLKEKNAVLQKNLDLSLGELRHNILLTRALAATNQNLLIELLAKQRKTTPDEVVEDANKLFAEFYKTMKEEGSFSYVGK